MSTNYPAEALYKTRWKDPHRELLSLATDEAMGRVRPTFAAEVRKDIQRAEDARRKKKRAR